MAKSTTAKARIKPEKPYPKFPLFAHATGRWAKKIRGKLVYFGPWEDPHGANALYEAQASDLHAGRPPRVSTGVTTIADACNHFLTAKQARVDSGELSKRFFDELHDVAGMVVDHFGPGREVADIAPAEFTQLRGKLAKGVGLNTLSKRIQGVRSLFKHSYEIDLIDRPVKMGPDFKKPNKSVLRKFKNTQPAKSFTAAEITVLIGAATEPLKTMILLGVNCGFGNHDVGTLPWSVVDLEGGWIDYPRPKTGVARRCPLWPETIAALKAWKELRPEPDDAAHSGLVFVTRWGAAYAKPDGDRSNPISQEFRKLLERTGLVEKRPAAGKKSTGARKSGRGFYGLRHTFETISGQAADQVATDLVMGHCDPSMAATYRGAVWDDRLHRVVDFVRDWLLMEPEAKKNAKARRATK